MKKKNTTENNTTLIVLIAIVLIFVVGIGIFIYAANNSGQPAKVVIDESLRGNSEDFDRGEVISVADTFKKDNSNTIYYFYADDCPHCQNIHDEVNDYFNELGAEVKIYLVKLTSYRNQEETGTIRTEMQKISEEYEGTPTINYFKDGKLQKDYIGVGESSSTNENGVLDVLKKIVALNNK